MQTIFVKIKRNGKTEMWYVIDAEEGASLIYGFQHKVTEEILRKAVETRTLDKYFEAERIQVTKGFSFSVREESFQVLMCMDGYGQVETMDADQKPMRFCKGETMLLPAGIGRYLVVGEAELLKILC